MSEGERSRTGRGRFLVAHCEGFGFALSGSKMGATGGLRTEEGCEQIWVSRLSLAIVWGIDCGVRQEGL